jgi:hypothetical protein
MKQGDVDGHLRQSVVRKGGIGRVAIPSDVVVHGLGHAAEEEADADAAGKQHHEPGVDFVKPFLPKFTDKT